MNRLAITLIALLATSSAAFALTTSDRQSSLSDRAVAVGAAKHPRTALVKESAQAEHEPQLVVNEETQVKVDGKTCRYEQVPANVEAVLIEVADDGKTIVKIHFRRLKR